LSNANQKKKEIGNSPCSDDAGSIAVVDQFLKKFFKSKPGDATGKSVVGSRLWVSQGE